MPVPINNTFRRTTIADESSMQISAIYLNNPTFNAGPQGDDLLSTESTDYALPPKLEMRLFEEIAELVEKSKTYQEEEKDFIRKIDKYERNIVTAEEMIEKAKNKLNLLVKRNEFLKCCIEDKECTVKKALKYWEDYGIRVKELPAPDEKSQQYEFEYTKLPCKVESITECVITLRYHEDKLEIIDQLPEIIQPDDLKELNERLTKNCISPKGNLADYKLAMLLIRKDLIKNLASYPKT